MKFQNKSIPQIRKIFEGYGAKNFEGRNYGDLQILNFEFKGWNMEATFRPEFAEDGIKIEFGFEEFDGESEFLEDDGQAKDLMTFDEWLECGSKEAEIWKEKISK